MPKNWCFWTVVLEKTLESLLDCKEIKPVNPKGNQSWIFTGRTEAETTMVWPPDVKNWLTGKDPDDGKDWRREKRITEDESWMVSPTGWTLVWASSESWWWAGKSGVLQSMGSQGVRHDWGTEHQKQFAVPLIYISFYFMPISHYFDYWSFEYNLKSRKKYHTSSFKLFPQEYFGNSVSFVVLYKL